MRPMIGSVIWGLAALGACGGHTERGDGKSNAPVIPADPPPPPVEEPAGSECPATPPNGYEQCGVAADTPCTWVWPDGWQRCRCPGEGSTTRTWDCEMCSGCSCPAELPETGDSCAEYPGATPCPSSGVHGYCSCSPSETWECSLEPGGVGGAGGWSGSGG